MTQNEEYQHVEWRDFREEIRKVQRGVKVLWLINFLLLTLVYNAAIIVAVLNVQSTNQEILTFLLISTSISLIGALITMWIVTRNSRKFITSGLGSTATEVQAGSQLHNVVEEIAIAAGMSQTPKVYVSSDNVMNAYAISDHNGNAYVAITQPLLDSLSRDEVTAVMAHELAHVQSGDSPSMTKLIALSSVISLVASIGWRMMFYGASGRNRGSGGNNGVNPVAIAIVIISLVFLMLAPLLQMIAQAFMSRQRETRADRLAVEYTRDPTSLAHALIKINNGTVNAVQNNSQIKKDVEKFNKTVGAMAFYKPGFIGKTFATHPPFEKRIKDLQAMGAQIEQ